MNSKKGTVRALIIVSVALALCLAMLVGSTLAWFNDSVKSAVNVIEAGNLDVELDYYDFKSTDGTPWETVDEQTELFTEKNWAPGRTEVVYFKITNKGSLDLKYSFGINLLKEKNGISQLKTTDNPEGKFFLSDYMNYGIVRNADPKNPLGDKAYNSVEDAYKFTEANSNSTSAKGTIDAGQSEVVALVVWMPTSVGNEANHNGKDIPSIEFGVSVFATQEEVEDDLVNPYYVPRAIVSDADEYENKTLDWKKFGSIPAADSEQTLESVYLFEIAEPEKAADSIYSEWNADFYVKVDKPIGAKEIFLGGNYGIHGWVGFENPKPVDAEVFIPLLGSAMGDDGDATFTFKDVVAFVKEFRCGVADIDDALAGVTFTVELRLTNPDPEKSDDYFVVSRISHTFTRDELPTAIVTNADQHENVELDWLDTGDYTPSNPQQQLEAAYIFKAPHEASDMSEYPYADWYTDYVVSVDKDVKAGQIFLGGNYGTFGWIGFENPMDVKANEEIPLLGSVTKKPWTYEMVVGQVKEFTCGVALATDETTNEPITVDENGNALPNLSGATFTVKLRLTNPTDSTEYYDVNTVSYTFQ